MAQPDFSKNTRLLGIGDLWLTVKRKLYTHLNENMYVCVCVCMYEQATYISCVHSLRCVCVCVIT